ncbi:MAG: hypothetical protein J0L93_08885 [Deltaproteobacteria bacterium]|nr:hypothetical protein [Deltaproteobacteria bacterium]
MKSTFKVLGAVFMPAVLLTGCGSLQLGDNVQLKLNPETQTANLEVEMSDGLQVSMTGDYPIANGKGRLYFVDATKTTNARIGVEVNLAAVAGSTMTDMGAITTLPNGSPLPVAMTPPLLTIPVLKNANFSLDAAFALSPDLQIASLIGIQQFSAKYVPAGIALCQNFRDSNNVAFAAVCIFGASASGKTGGIFVGANFGEVLNMDNLLASKSSSAKLFASSAPFTIQAKAISSSNFTSTMVDPKNLLKGSAVSKTISNVQKVLSVRR